MIKKKKKKKVTMIFKIKNQATKSTNQAIVQTSEKQTIIMKLKKKPTIIIKLKQSKQ
jgi:hypothetical protein